MTNQKNPNDYESMKKHFQAERLFVFLLAVLFCHYCNTPSVNQFCDPESKNYTNSVLLKMMTGDKSAYCGVNFVAPPANFSYPTTTTFANGNIFSLTPTVTGTSLSFTSSADFPSGISLNSSTGVISGSYSVFAGFTGNFTITATNPGGSANSTFNLTLFGKAPVKSGQTQCWDAAGALDATCGLSTSAGQDGKLQYGTAPSLTGPSLVNASDYIATDNNTGLIWKSCNEGKSGPACATGGISSLDWPTANSNCTTMNSGAGYANRADWRLATVEESVTIVSYSGVNPATFNANFPAASGGGTWTSSTYAPASSTTAWYVSF
ncbi:MAG: DUF1566 domain-containing protein, partial [Leptospira sp.]|nr:DUF1566 domain-containing protein [Leptospira sp.]